MVHYTSRQEKLEILDLHKTLIHLVKKVVGFEGDVIWDRSRADGTPRKLLDVSAMHALGWRHETPLEEGIRLAYADFLANWRD